MRVVASLVLLTDAALASRCNGHSPPGPRNLHPIDDAKPVFVKQVINGKLYTVGQGDDKRDLVHVWGTPYENGLAMGQLLGPKVVKFIRDTYVYTEGQVVANLANVTWCAAHRLQCVALRGVMKAGLSAALDLSYRVTEPYIKPYVMEEIRGLADATGCAAIRSRVVCHSPPRLPLRPPLPSHRAGHLAARLPPTAAGRSV